MHAYANPIHSRTLAQKALWLRSCNPRKQKLRVCPGIRLLFRFSMPHIPISISYDHHTGNQVGRVASPAGEFKLPFRIFDHTRLIHGHAIYQIAVGESWIDTEKFRNFDAGPLPQACITLLNPLLLRAPTIAHYS
jgi:hypothetical protein